MNYYSLMRNFWDFAFANPEKIKPNHCAVYCFAVEHCNRLGWKEKFGFPTEMVKDAVGIASYNTYIKTLNELVEFGLIVMIQKSINQYSACVIALSKFDEAHNKALDEATIKHSIKQEESTVQSTIQSTVQSNDSIIRPIYQSTNLQINQSISKNKILISELKVTPTWIEAIQRQNKITQESVFSWLDAFGLKLSTEMSEKYSKKDFCEHFARWLPIEIRKQKSEGFDVSYKKEKVGGF